MVKLARILLHTSSPHAKAKKDDDATGTPVLCVQIPSSSFRSSEIQSHFAENDVSPSTIHYVDVSRVVVNVDDGTASSSASASAFLSMGTVASSAAAALVERASSPSLTLSCPFFAEHVILNERVARVLSPLDGRSEVGKFLCIGMNYVDHCTEQNVPVPEVPLVFSKFGSCVVGPGDAIPRYGPSPSSSASHGGTNADLDPEPIVTSKLDYEVELGIVIGRTVPRFTSAEDAPKYIGGYTVIHDVSARDLQLEANGGQWLLGKCGDGYGAMGPAIATLNEFDDDGDAETKAGAADLRLECRLTRKGADGVAKTTTVQSGTTANLVFSTPRIVSYLSKFVTLYPGDVIATGTPPGVGCFRKPDPLWLEPGDVVECEIEGIGMLRNVVVERTEEKDSSKEEESECARDKTSAVDAAPSPTAAAVEGPPPRKDDGIPQKQRLKNAVCVVTGGARGLGYGIALRLALEGAVLVALVDLNQSGLDAAADQLEAKLRQILGKDETASSGRTFYGIACDVADTDAVAAAFRAVAALSPDRRIDVLVQAAGVVGRTNLLAHEVPPDDFDFVMNVNVKGIFNGCQAALPYMLRQKYGRIVNIASIAGKEGNAGMLAYSTSKAAVIGLTKTVGKEYAGRGVDITCNAIAPAVVRTEMVAGMPEEQVKYMTDKIPMKRCGKVEEIASLAAYIASEEAGFTTGFCWDATGGRSVY